MPNTLTKIEVKVEIERNKTQLLKKIIEIIKKQLALTQFKDVNLVSIKEVK